MLRASRVSWMLLFLLLGGCSKTSEVSNHSAAGAGGTSGTGVGGTGGAGGGGAVSGSAGQTTGGSAGTGGSSCQPKSCDEFGIPCGSATGSCDEALECGACPLLVSVGHNTTCARIVDGTLRCWGENDAGQVGTGALGGVVSTPSAVSNLTSVISVSIGRIHTCAVTAAGFVYCWGANTAGQLGMDPDTSGAGEFPLPALVEGLDDVVEVGSGSDFTCARKAAGGILCWGSNDKGQLGDGTNTARFFPQPVSGLALATTLAVGAGHACAMNSSGDVLCWGDNEIGQIGSPVGTDTRVPRMVSALIQVESLFVGQSTSCVAVAGGNLWCWGSNSGGLLLQGSTDNGPHPTPVQALFLSGTKAMGIGNSYAIAADTSGVARAWGDNEKGQLGNGNPHDQFILEPVQVQNVSNFSRVAAGNKHSCGVTTTEELYCWGGTTLGQLGDGSSGTSAVKSTPTKISP